MRTRNWLMPMSIAAAAIFVAGCDKTGEGQYEVQRPVVGTTTDTVSVPTVNVGTDTARVVTPDVDVVTPAERRDTTRRRP